MHLPTLPLEEQEHQLGWKTVKPFAASEEAETPQSENFVEFDTAEDEFEEADFEEDESELEYESSAESISQHMRRTKLPKPKPTIRSEFRPIPKPNSVENTDSINSEEESAEEPSASAPDESESNKPFDPWLGGLEEDAEEDDQPVILKIGFEQPPRIAKKTSIP